MDWTNVEKLLNNSTYITLISGMFLYWLSLFFINSKIFFSLAKYTSIFSNILLFINLLGRWINAKYFPLSNLYESLLFLCWTLLFGQIIIEKKSNSKIIGAINLPVVLLLNVFATLSLPLEMQKISPLVPSLQSNWLMMHVTMMMLSYGTLILGSLLSILYVILSLKKKTKDSEKNLLNSFFLVNNKLLTFDEVQNTNENTNVFFNQKRVSLLETIDIWSYRIIGLGFPLLSLGIISGAVWANEAWGSYWSWDPKETWALITWLVFAIYLHARLTKGLKGIQTAVIGSLGFFIIWICYLGVNFLGKGLHSYGWLS
jgi:cytochrome c-type biogenesis protein CcsB